MLYRKIVENLIKWKNKSNKKPLLIKGARQIGKTYIVREFGKTNYESFIELNLYEDIEIRKIFEETLDIETLKKKITTHLPDAYFIEGKTLIFIDEIEFSPNARTALKFICEDGRYDCIATGSLLSINYKDVLSIPVGYEEQIEMHSLDFEEFLIACGFKNSIEIVREYFEKKIKIPFSINKDLIDRLREYIIVGGMPEVVNNYVNNYDMNSVFDLQANIIASNENDILKYAQLTEKPKVKNCYLSIPSQLSKVNKKFMFSKVESRGTRPKYINSIEWLRDSNIIKLSYNMSSMEFPRNVYCNLDQFKVYMSDIGLLTCMYGKETRKAIMDNTIKGNVKGGIYENLVADMLSKRDETLFYYKNTDSTKEIEFLIERDESLVPVEVKAGNNNTLSLNTALENEDIKYGYKLIDGNIGVEGKKITLPLYMAMFI